MTVGDSAEVALPAASDLTAKARIRNAALELLADKGSANTTIREIAKAAGVTHGLVVHHFTNKDGLRRAVRQHVIRLVREALASTPPQGTAAEVRRARDASVDRMLTNNPVVTTYLRRAMLDPAETDDTLIAMLADFTLAEVRSLRSRGLAATNAPDYTQAMAVMARELGPRLLVPAMDRIWNHLTEGTAGPPPELEVRTMSS
ncbi:MAG TPA: TetR/AcrR family transcriptional regulator [Mycobacterium sp.]|jgi:AcrR family transcriptional regulator|nr:TetR/AcrR family transcriptional regulator [Mycobacterium sp.]